MFPDGRQFAFTILDDTDDSTVDNVQPLYDLLRELGFRTTKTAWPLDCPEGSRLYFAAETLQDPRYRRFVHELHEQGFELAWHCATMESSRRDRTERGLEFFRREFGSVPRIHCNHGHNRENIYWGAKRYHSAVVRRLMGRNPLRRARGACAGDEPDSPYFWGDLCQRHFRFVRNFTFSDINQQKWAPVTPYRLETKPWVNAWFCTSDAADATAFRRLVHRQSIDRLQRQGGVCILSTHLGKGYVRDGRVDPQVEDALRYLARLPGWFVPVSEILEHFIETRPADARLGPLRALRLDLLHLADRGRTRWTEGKR